MYLDLWFQQLAVDQVKYINPAHKLACRVHDCHTLDFNAVVTFSQGRVLSLARCVCGLLNVHGRLVVTFCYGLPMVSCHWTTGGLVLMGVYEGEG